MTSSLESVSWCDECVAKVARGPVRLSPTNMLGEVLLWHLISLWCDTYYNWRLLITITLMRTFRFYKYTSLALTLLPENYTWFLKLMKPPTNYLVIVKALFLYGTNVAFTVFSFVLVKTFKESTSIWGHELTILGLLHNFQCTKAVSKLFVI